MWNMFKTKSKNTRTTSDISVFSVVIVFSVNFEHISHIFLLFLFLQINVSSNAMIYTFKFGF